MSGSWGLELWDQLDNIIDHSNINSNLIEKCHKCFSECQRIWIKSAVKQKRLLEKLQSEFNDPYHTEFTITSSLLSIINNFISISNINSTYSESTHKTSKDIFKKSHSALKEESVSWIESKKKMEDELYKERKKYELSLRRYRCKQQALLTAVESCRKTDSNPSVSRNQVDISFNNYHFRREEYDQAKGEYAYKLEKFNTLQRKHFNTLVPNWTEKGEKLYQKRLEMVSLFGNEMARITKEMVTKMNYSVKRFEDIKSTLSFTKDANVLVQKLKTGDAPPSELKYIDLDLKDAIPILSQNCTLNTNYSDDNFKSNKCVDDFSDEEYEESIENNNQEDANEIENYENKDIVDEGGGGDSQVDGPHIGEESSDYSFTSSEFSSDGANKRGSDNFKRDNEKVKMRQKTSISINYPTRSITGSQGSSDTVPSFNLSANQDTKSDIMPRYLLHSSRVKKVNKILNPDAQFTFQKSAKIFHSSVPWKQSNRSSESAAAESNNTPTQRPSLYKKRSRPDQNRPLLRHRSRSVSDMITEFVRSSFKVKSKDKPNQDQRRMSKQDSVTEQQTRAATCDSRKAPEVEIVNTPAEAVAMVGLRKLSMPDMEYLQKGWYQGSSNENYYRPPSPDYDNDIVASSDVATIEQSVSYSDNYVGSCVAKYDFNGLQKSDGYLSFLAGDQFYILQLDNENPDWLWVEKTDQTARGYVPTTYFDVRRFNEDASTYEAIV